MLSAQLSLARFPVYNRTRKEQARHLSSAFSFSPYYFHWIFLLRVLCKASNFANDSSAQVVSWICSLLHWKSTCLRSRCKCSVRRGHLLSQCLAPTSSPSKSLALLVQWPRNRLAQSLQTQSRTITVGGAILTSKEFPWNHNVANWKLHVVKRELNFRGITIKFDNFVSAWKSNICLPRHHEFQHCCIHAFPTRAVQIPAASFDISP